MAVAPAVIVAFVFNPPQISITGPVQDSTIAKLNLLLPTLTSNSCQGRRKPESFQLTEAPVRQWTVEYRALVCDDIAELSVMLAVLDALEDEGGWSMRDTHAANHDVQSEYMFFFTRKSR